ncbi:MAG TPA: O-antigen ligase family protein [Chloroflexota bacterium]|nr:O-antigen ligase family protein [Chloroflexota bacterium]
MTAVLSYDDARTQAQPTSRWLGNLPEHLGALLLLLWWALPMTRGTGGREPHLLSIGLVIVVTAVVANRVWRWVRPRELVAAAGLVAAALVVCLASPVGWRGANELGNWAFAAGTFVVARSYLRTTARVRGVLLAVALTGMAQFATGWLAWWGGENPAQPMIGSFYWHNQFAAFLLAPAIIAKALAVWPRRPGVAAGWFVAPICSAGILFSTSRATLGLLVVGWLAAGVVALLRPGRRGSMARLLALAALTVVTSFVLTGPPFFPHRALPSAAVAQRTQEQSAGGNAEWRTKVWEQVPQVYAAYPVTGTGFHGFFAGTSKVTHGKAQSAFAHNAWLQAFAEGGTVLGLPFLLISLLAVAAVVRRIVRAVRKRGDPQGALVGVAALVLAAHSLVDFDTSYPTLFAMLAIAFAVALAPSWQGEPDVGDGVTARRRRPVVVAFAASGLLCAVALVAVVPAWHGGLHLNLPLRPVASAGR